MSFTLDTRKFADAIKFVVAVTPRTMSDALNRGGKTVIIGAKGVKGAMQLTPKANKAAIAATPVKEVAAYVAQKLRKEGQKVDAATFKELVKKEYARRKRAAGYTAYAGWSNAAKAFGGRGVRGVTESQKKLARFGEGKKATSEKLVAEIVNTAPAAPVIGKEALQEAVDNAAGDIVAYGVKKLQQQMDKVGAR